MANLSTRHLCKYIENPRLKCPMGENGIEARGASPRTAEVDNSVRGVMVGVGESGSANEARRRSSSGSSKIPPPGDELSNGRVHRVSRLRRQGVGGFLKIAPDRAKWGGGRQDFGKRGSGSGSGHSSRETGLFKTGRSSLLKRPSDRATAGPVK
jgi:hypothetical protein